MLNRLTICAALFLTMATFCSSHSANADDPPSEIRGTVLLPNGSPAANVPVIAAWRKLDNKTTTDEKGAFLLEFDSKEIDRKLGSEWKHVAIAAFGDGCGTAWEKLGNVKQDQQLTLQLVEDLPVKGRIVDQQGRPVAGASISVFQLHDEGGELDGFLQASRDKPTTMEMQQYRYANMKTLHTPFISSKHAEGNFTTDNEGGLVSGYLEDNATTDNDGGFVLHGFGAHRVLRAEVSGPGIAKQTINIATTQKIDVKWKRTSLSRQSKMHLESGSSIEPVFPAEFSLIAEPGLTIRGTLLDAMTGDPIQGMNVIAGMRGSLSNGYDNDIGSNGKFEIHGLPLEGELRISALNPGSSPYLDGQKTIEIKGDSAPDEIVFKLDRGVRVFGKVTDEDGNPVKGHVGYLAWAGNPKLKKLNESYLNFNIFQVNEHGEYRIVVPQGPGVISFQAADFKRFEPPQDEDFGLPMSKMSGVNALLSQNRGLVPASFFTVVKHVEPTEDDVELKVDLIASTGSPITGTVADANGKLIDKVIVRGLLRAGRDEITDGKFQVRGLRTDEQRDVFFRSEDLKWAAIKQFSKDSPSDRQVKLPQTGTISMRLLDDSGKPLSKWSAGAATPGLKEFLEGKGDKDSTRPFDFANGVCDADGYVYLKGIPANTKVDVIAGSPSKYYQGEFIIVRTITLRPGQKLEMDAVKVGNEIESDN